MNMMITTFVFVCLQSTISVKEARDAYFGSSEGKIEATEYFNRLRTGDKNQN